MANPEPTGIPDDLSTVPLPEQPPMDDAAGGPQAEDADRN